MKIFDSLDAYGPPLKRITYRWVDRISRDFAIWLIQQRQTGLERKFSYSQPGYHSMSASNLVFKFRSGDE